MLNYCLLISYFLYLKFSEVPISPNDRYNVLARLLLRPISLLSDHSSAHQRVDA